MFANQPIPRAEMVRFLQAKAPHAKCCACGRSDFAGFDEFNVNGAGEEARMALIGFPFGGYDIHGAKATDVVVFACNNCGTVWQLLRSTMMSWLNANPR